MLQRVVAYVSNRQKPTPVRIDIRSAEHYVVLDPEYGEPIMLELSGTNLDALVLTCKDISGERHTILVASVP